VRAISPRWGGVAANIAFLETYLSRQLALIYSRPLFVVAGRCPHRRAPVMPAQGRDVVPWARALPIGREAAGARATERPALDKLALQAGAVSKKRLALAWSGA
jgi:hypothetical protein